MPFNILAKVAGGILGLEAADDQRDINVAAAEDQYTADLENIRLRRFEQDQTIGETVLRIGASGVRGGTGTRYLEQMDAEFSTEIDFLYDYAQRSRDNAIRGAEVQYDADRLNSFAAIFDGISDTVSMFAGGGGGG